MTISQSNSLNLLIIMSFNISSINQKLSKPISFFGIKLWVALIICIVLAILLILIITFCIIYQRRRKSQTTSKNSNLSKNTIQSACSTSLMNRRLLSRNGWDIELSIGTPEKQVMYADHRSTQASGTINDVNDMESAARYPPLANIKLGNMYRLSEIEAATNGFTHECVIGTGDYGVVYRGVLFDNTLVAVKNITNNNRVMVKDFIRKVEEISSLRHKNLVKLLGFCAEGAYRMIIYEYVDNGNLKQWLHDCTCQISPLTWSMRMNIILGIAKGLAYLHESSEPAVVHQRLKSSNIMLDKQWCPKLSDYGLAKLLGPERHHAIASPTGMSGYIAPEYSYTGVLDEKSDVYSFGVLIMEIISGKTPVEYSVTEIEEHLVDWMKSMVANQDFDSVLDPKLPATPSIKELKRILLIALRCVDPDIENRPKMGEIIHMLEPRDLLLSDDRVIKRVTSRRSSSRDDQSLPD